MISMLVDAEAGKILACVCSAGNAVNTTRLRALLNAFELTGHSYCRRSGGAFFKTCSIVRGVSGRAVTNFDEWQILHFDGARSALRHVKPEWAEMFFYYLYDWPLNCYPVDDFRNLSYTIFRRLVLNAVERYSIWLDQKNNF
ncbi:hypothetical protein [Pseudomonas monteilii]|nr:hypothetical protein [Pseudomonas monteilii]MCE1015695.1 hypothetical protein [Pseudomonas monteilii]WJR47582.1 hypothetical protein LU654_013685 [Pseudomonas monteilii]